MVNLLEGRPAIRPEIDGRKQIERGLRENAVI